MKKIIMLVILLLGVGVCNVNANPPKSYFGYYSLDNEYEVFEEYNPDVHKFTYLYGCIGTSYKEYIDGQVASYIETNTIGEYYVDVYVSYVDVCSTKELIEHIFSVKITVRDTISPTINGIKNYILEYGSKLPDFSEGISYYDNYSFKSDINFSINDLSVDMTRLGEYFVYYTAVDESGNTTVEASTVKIVDTSAPSLSTPKSLTVDVGDYTYDFRKDATASDLLEGDVTSRIIIDYKDLDIYRLGSYQIEYKVEDMSGNISSSVVTVNIVDREKPVINNVNEIAVEYGTDIDNINFGENVFISDNYYDNLELNYDLSKVNTNIIGDYLIVYYTIDGSGNICTVSSTVHVVDSINPTLEVLNNNIIVTVGDSNYDFKKHFSMTDNYFESPILAVDTSNVIFNSPGIYPIVATARDYFGNVTQMTLNITVAGVTDLTDKPTNTDGVGVNSDEYESKDITKVIKPILILAIPIAAFVLAKSYLLKGH